MAALFYWYTFSYIEIIMALSMRKKCTAIMYLHSLSLIRPLSSLKCSQIHCKHDTTL